MPTSIAFDPALQWGVLPDAVPYGESLRIRKERPDLLRRRRDVDRDAAPAADIPDYSPPCIPPDDGETIPFIRR